VPLGYETVEYVMILVAPIHTNDPSVLPVSIPNFCDEKGSAPAFFRNLEEAKTFVRVKGRIS
jgi:hypothetical protein